MNFLSHYINKIIVFFKPAKATYWHTITENTLDCVPQKPGRYYLNFQSKLNYPEKFDENSIPIWRNKNEEYFHHPIVICQYALGVFEHLYQKNYQDDSLRSSFISLADWLKNNFVEINCGKVWYIYYDIPLYRIKKPWYSALAQGEAVSVLVRAYYLTNDRSYLELAEDAIKPFFVEVKDGGLLNYFNSIPIYEEYPSPIKTVGVLNGFMFSLLGLYDLILTTQSKNATKLFTTGIESLKKLLPFYDTGYWARYFIFDYPKNYLASYTYINLMSEQLKALYYLTNEEIFLFYSTKWKEYSGKLQNKFKALIKKLFYANTFFK